MEPYQTEIFKFLAVRAPKSAEQSEAGDRHIRYPQDHFSTLESTLFNDLSDKKDETGSSLAGLQEVVSSFQLSDDWFPDKQSVWDSAPGLQELHQWIYENRNLTDVSGISAKAVELTGYSPADSTGAPGAVEFESRLWDNLIAEAVLPSRTGIGDALCSMIRLQSLMRKIAENDPDLNAPGGISKHITASVILPKPLFPLIFDHPGVKEGEVEPAEIEPDVSAALEEIDQLKNALEEVQKIFVFKAEEERYKPISIAVEEETSTSTNKTTSSESEGTDLRVFSAEMFGAATLETQT